MTRTNQEIAEAEVVPQLTSSNMYVLRFGEDEYDDVPRTPKTELLVESGVLGEAAGGVEFDDVYAEADLDNDEYRLRKSGRYLSVPSDKEHDFLQMLANGDGDGLSEMYDDIRSKRVREGLMDRFMPRFSEAREEGRLEKTDDGWLIDDTFVVRWDAENRLKGVDQYEVTGGGVEKINDERPARLINFSIDGPVETQTPDGMRVELSEREQKFLGTAQILLNPREWLDDEEAEKIEEQVAKSNDELDAIASSANVEKYTDESDGVWHRHDMNKHSVFDVNVTQEVADMLEFRADGHTGIHELAMRKQEFQDADVDIFEDTNDFDKQRWQEVERRRGKAKIPQTIRNELKRKYK